MVIGLSTITLNVNSTNLDQQIQSLFPNFLNAIIALCEKSLQIRQKKLNKVKDHDSDEEAIEDHDCEREAIFDEDDEEIIEIEESEEEYEDEEWDLDDDESENELYDTKIDKIDEILFVRDQIATL